MSLYCFLNDQEHQGLEDRMKQGGFDTTNPHNFTNFLLWKAGVIDQCPPKAAGV